MAVTAAEVFRDYTTDGIPSSGIHEPKKREIRTLLSGYEQVINAFTSNGGLIYSSKAAMDADIAHAANSMAWVVGDATAANNGVYQKSGASGTGSWTRVADLPYSFIVASDVGDGTPDAIVATSSLPVSGSALVLLNIFEANTGSPVTVSFNGGTPLTVKTNSGNDVAPGGLVSGMLVMGRVSSTTFRLVSDQVSAAVLAQAEDAAILAQAWAEGTEPGGVGTKSSKEWSQAAEAATVYNRVVVRGTLAGVGPYDMGVEIGSANNIDIKIDGVIQDHNEYTILGTEFTLNADPGALPYEAVVQSTVRELGVPSDGTVNTVQLADGAVTEAKLADNAVATTKIADEAITLGKLAYAVQAMLSSSEIYPSEYNVVGDNVSEDSTELTAWINAWKATDPAKDAIFSTGTYLTTSKLPSLFKAKGRFLGKGRPVIRYAGAALSDLVEVSAASNSYNVHIKNLGINGNSITQGLFMTNKVHHSTFEDIYLRNCSTSHAAMKILFAVMNTYRNIVCSFNNEGAFTYTPLHGILVGNGTSSAEQCIDCTFEQLKLEGLGSTGLVLTNSWYNTFTNGSSEGNGGGGVYIADYSKYNTFIGFFCEVNGAADFDVFGHSNVFINCEGLSTTGVSVTGDNNVFIGGRYSTFTVNSGATGTILDNVEITGTYTNNGTGTVVR